MIRDDAAHTRETFEKLLWTASVHQWARQTMDLLDTLIHSTAAADLAYLRDAIQTVFADGERKKEEYIVGLILSAKLGDDRQHTIDHAIRHLFQKLQHRDFHFICEYLFEDALPLPENLIYDITARIIFDIRDRFDQIAQDFKHVPKKNAEAAILYLAFELCRADLNLQNRDLLYLILSRIQVPMPARLVSIANENLDRIRTSLQNKGIKDLEAITFSDYEDAAPARVDTIETPKVALPKTNRDDYYAVRRTLENPNYERTSDLGESEPDATGTVFPVSDRNASAPDHGPSRETNAYQRSPRVPKEGGTQRPDSILTDTKGDRTPAADAPGPLGGEGKGSPKATKESGRSGLNFTTRETGVDSGPRKDVITRNEGPDQELPSTKSGSPDLPVTPQSPDRPRRQRREAETTDAEGMGLDLGTIDDILREGARSGTAAGESPESRREDSSPASANPAADSTVIPVMNRAEPTAIPVANDADTTADPEGPAYAVPAVDHESQVSDSASASRPEKKAPIRKIRRWIWIAAGFAIVALIVVVAVEAGNHDSSAKGVARPGNSVSPVSVQSPVSAFDTSAKPADSTLDIRESAGVAIWTVGSGQSFWTVFSSQAVGTNGPESWSSFIARIRGLNPGLAKAELIYPGQSYRIR